MRAAKMFLLCLVSLLIASARLDVSPGEKLNEFERKLDSAGLDLIDRMYDNYDQRMKREESDGDGLLIADHSSRRSRRSVILDQVKAARKTGNREELFLRSSIPYKKLLQIFDPTDIVPIALKLDRPYNTMEKPMFFAVANYRNPLGSFDSAVIILRYNKTSDNFTVHQFLNEYAPYELESFSGKVNPIANKNFLSVAGFIDDDQSGSDGNTKISIYEISPPPFFIFNKMQELRQHSVRAMKYIQIEQITYLILGMYYQVTRYGKQYASPSQLLLLRFDVASNLFHFHSSLPGSGVTDIECFTVRGKTYLTVANYRDNDGRLGILSYIYVYNDQIRGFEMMQYLSTNGARDIEHFTLANEKYLVVANEATGTTTNKTFNVDSDVYKLSNGRFEMIQKLTTYGAVKWKSIAVPNCKQDVLLVYSDQRNDIDQVGIYTFSHDAEMFRTDQFSIYHLDFLNSTFRPNARALSAYSLQDEDTGEFSLYLIVGASDVTEGNTIYKLSYEVILTDSPLDAFKRNVEEELISLKQSLESVKMLLATARSTLKDAVTKSGTETITGTKTIFGNLEAEHANIKILNITKGGMFQTGNKTSGNASQSIDAYFSEVKASIVRQNSSINNILEQKDEFMYVNVDQNVTSHMQFNQLDSTTVTVGGNVTIQSNYINDVNLTDILDIVMRNEDTVITGTKSFSKSISTGNVDVNGFVNGLNFTTDLVLHNVDQTIFATKMCTRSIDVSESLITGTINGGEYIKKALFVNQPGNVTGTNSFTSNVDVRSAKLEYVNGLDIEDIMSDRVTKSTEQNISGSKTFEGLLSHGDVEINGTINGIDLSQLQRRLESIVNVSTLHGDKIFYDNITVTENLIIENGINESPFPENVLMKSSSQTVLAEKIFEGGITVNNLHVAGHVDGLNMSDVVTLDTAETIFGLKKFENVNLKNDMHLVENNTVNGIDISEFVKEIISTSDNESFTALKFLDPILVRNASVSASINNKTLSSFHEIWETCLHLHGEQNITGGIVIENNITISRNVTAGLINNYNFPYDFGSTTANQTFYGNKTFEDSIVVSDVNVNGTVNDIDFNKFNDDIVTDKDDLVYGVKTIYGDVFVHGALHTAGEINGLNFRHDLMFKDTEQNVTAKKYFEVMNFGNNDIKVIGDILVDATIDGVDLSELELSGMTRTKNETVTGEKCFAQTDYNRSTDLINGVDLSALRDDIVTVNTDQVIRSKKIFNTILLTENLNTTSTIDGIDVSDLNERMVLSNQNSTIKGHVEFKRSLVINGSLNASTVDGLDMQNMQNEFVSLSNNVTLHNLTIVGNVTVNTLEVNTVNGIATDDIVYRSKHQVISGVKQFGNTTFKDLRVNGTVNGVNLSSLITEVVYKDTNQTIFGKKVFEDVEVINLNSSGFVNGIDLRNWNILRTSSNQTQTVYGKKLFNAETEIDDLTIEGAVNGKNLSLLFKDAVLTHGNYTLEHVTFKDKVDVQGDLSVSGNVSSESVNGINLTEFNEKVLKTTGEQNITRMTITGATSANIINVAGSINGLNVSEDLVTKATPQQIRGLKNFSSVELQSVTAHELVGGVNLTDLATNTLFQHANETQVISGMKSIQNCSMDVVRCHGFVDGLNMTNSTFVTLHTKQIIRARKHFSGPENFISNGLNVLGKVAGVDLITFNRSRVLLTRDQTITSEMEFMDDVTVDKNVVISGLVNNIDVSEFNMSSPDIDETALGIIQKNLSNSLSNQCKSLTYVKNSLKTSATQFDFFTERQKIDGYSVEHAEFFQVGNDSFLATAISRNKFSHCTNSFIKRWNTTKMQSYQSIPTSGAVKTVFFDAPWNESYLLIVNSKSGCSNVEGPSQLFRWNSTSDRFQMTTSLATIDATDAVVHKQDDTVIIFISNANNLSSWILTSTGAIPYYTENLKPIALHAFQSNSIAYLAVAVRFDESSSSGYVKVYKIEKGNLTFAQPIDTKGTSSITSFDVNGITYLVIANDRAYSASGLSTYYLTVDIYRLSNDRFEWFNSIPTYRAYRVTTFRVGSFTYLAITHYDDHVSFYLFGLEFGFQKAEKLSLNGIRDATYIQNDGKRYVLLVANSPSVPAGASKLMELHSSGPDRKKVELIDSCQVGGNSQT